MHMVYCNTPSANVYAYGYLLTVLLEYIDLFQWSSIAEILISHSPTTRVHALQTLAIFVLPICMYYKTYRTCIKIMCPII